MSRETVNRPEAVRLWRYGYNARQIARILSATRSTSSPYQWSTILSIIRQERRKDPTIPKRPAGYRGVADDIDRLRQEGQALKAQVDPGIVTTIHVEPRP